MRYPKAVAVILMAALLTSGSVSATEPKDTTGGTPAATDEVSEDPTLELEEDSLLKQEEDSMTDLKEDATLSVMDTDLDSIFSSMQDSLLSGEDVSISDAFNALSKQEISQEALFDMSDLSLDSSFDSGLLNIQYTEMVDNMMDSPSLMDAQGQSLNCMQLFDDTYGDVLSQIQLEEPTIPEGFTVNSMLEAGQNAVDQAYSSVTSSGDFATVKNSISIGNVFSIANKGLTMPDLASGETLSGMLGDLNSGNKGQIEGEFNANENVFNDYKSNYQQDMVKNTKEKLLSMADIADHSLFYFDDCEDFEGNVDHQIDRIRHARRAESLTGKGVNLVGDAKDLVVDGMQGAFAMSGALEKAVDWVKGLFD